MLLLLLLGCFCYFYPDIENLQIEFHAIGEEFKKFLNSNRENCANFCGTIKDSVDNWIGLEDIFLKWELDEMKLEDIFKRLRRYVFNFMDFDVLSSLIRQCGEPSLFEKMKIYEEKVKIKCGRITVTELIAHWSPPIFACDIPESFKTCVTEMFEDPNKCKAEDLRRLGLRFEHMLITQRIGMEAAHFHLVQVSESSVIALWVVFTNMWPKLMEEAKKLIHEDSEFVQEIHLSVFILDDYIIYPSTDREEVRNERLKV